LVTEAQILEAVGILVREARPQKVILFGSYARGQAGPDSDVDFLVVEAGPIERIAEMARLRGALGPLRIPVDVIVTSEEQLRSSWADFPGSYLYDALREGKTLYAVG
jgi:predicted nucleotidyltransferase